MINVRIIAGPPHILGSELEKWLKETEGKIKIIRELQSESCTVIYQEQKPLPGVPITQKQPQIFLNITLTILYEEIA